MSDNETKTIFEMVEHLVNCYNYGCGYCSMEGFDENLTMLFQAFGYEYDEASDTQGGLVKSGPSKVMWIGMDLAKGE